MLVKNVKIFSNKKFTNNFPNYWTVLKSVEYNIVLEFSVAGFFEYSRWSLFKYAAGFTPTFAVVYIFRVSGPNAFSQRRDGVRTQIMAAVNTPSPTSSTRTFFPWPDDLTAFNPNRIFNRLTNCNYRGTKRMVYRVFFFSHPNLSIIYKMNDNKNWRRIIVKTHLDERRQFFALLNIRYVSEYHENRFGHFCHKRKRKNDERLTAEQDMAAAAFD